MTMQPFLISRNGVFSWWYMFCYSSPYNVIDISIHRLKLCDTLVYKITSKIEDFRNRDIFQIHLYYLYFIESLEALGGCNLLCW